MVDSTRARSLVEAVGISDGDIELTQIPGGTINQTFRLAPAGGPPLVLRIAPSDADVTAGPSWLTSHGLRREQEILRMLGDLADLLPQTIHFDDSRELIDRDWVVQTMVPGQSWIDARASLDDRTQQHLWRELGHVTARIHAVAGEEFGPPAAELGVVRWSEQVRWDATGCAVDAHRYGIDPAPFEALCALVDRGVPLLDQIHEPRLIHSDLGLHHVFVAPDRSGTHHITGLIDFEFGRFADPLSESVFVAHALDPVAADAFAAFCEGYGCPPHRHEDDVRLQIYQLVALGWTATDLVRRGHRDQVKGVLATMGDIQREVDRKV